jgi:hypothetical protein
MTFEKAIKRLRQETAPATYCPDFDKEECLKVFEKEHKALEIIKKTKNIKTSFYENGSGKHYKLEFDITKNQTITEQEYDLLKEILNDDSKHNEEEKERS